MDGSAADRLSSFTAASRGEYESESGPHAEAYSKAHGAVWPRIPPIPSPQSVGGAPYTMDNVVVAIAETVGKRA